MASKKSVRLTIATLWNNSTYGVEFTSTTTDSELKAELVEALAECKNKNHTLSKKTPDGPGTVI